MVSSPPVSLSSVITVISVIALITTYLLGELSDEDRMARDRVKPIYKKYLRTMSVGLVLATLSLLPVLLLQYEIKVQLSKQAVILLFSAAILVVSISTLLLSYELIETY